MYELVEGLLACEDAQERGAFLEGWGEPFSHLRLVEGLKQRADGMLRTDPAQARRLADVAQEIATHADDPLCQAAAAWCAGNAGFYLGRYQECLEYYRQAIPVYQEADMGLEAARLRANCVAVLTDLGRYEDALDEAAIARQGLAAHGATRFLAALEMNVAVLHRHLDDYGAALAACDRGREIALALGNSVQAARFAVNRALILENLDSYRAAVATLAEILPVFDEHGEVMEAARTQLNLGLLYTRMGRYPPRHCARVGRGRAGLCRAGQRDGSGRGGLAPGWRLPEAQPAAGGNRAVRENEKYLRGTGTGASGGYGRQRGGPGLPTDRRARGGIAPDGVGASGAKRGQGTCAISSARPGAGRPLCG